MGGDPKLLLGPMFAFPTRIRTTHYFTFGGKFCLLKEKCNICQLHCYNENNIKATKLNIM